MNREELNARFGVTEEQLDAWAEACERGEYPGEPTGEIIIGRPLKFGEELRSITFKDTGTKLEGIDERCEELGLSRSDYLRILVSLDLEKHLIVPEDIEESEPLLACA